MGPAIVALLFWAGAVAAQTDVDPSARLRQVLPADVATRVLAVIADARSRGLPADALENRALKFAARGVAPSAIERSVVEQEERMEQIRAVLQSARGRAPNGDEVDAGAEALRKGVDGAKVGALARNAPRDRSLAVPLYVIGSLLDRGLPSDAALERVQDKLRARASDRDLEKMAADVASQAAEGRGRGRGAEMGRALGETKRPGGAPGNGQNGSAGGRPAGVPGNGGKPATPPGRGKKPTPPGKRP
jgi:hypothetical protein